MEPSEAANAATKMSELFHGVEPEHAAHWAREFKSKIYRFEDVCQAMEGLRTASNFFDPERFHAIHNRIRAQRSDTADQLRKAQERMNENSVRDYWLSVDTCIDAMPQDEFDSLAAIALTEIPNNIRERFASKDLHTIKSIRGRVFELYRTEQPA